MWYSTEDKWGLLGNTAVGAALNNSFESSMSLSSDGKTLPIGLNSNDTHGLYSGHVILVACYSITHKCDQLGDTLLWEA